MPHWIVCTFLTLTFARGVRSIISGRLSALRMLRCGLDMGGPALPFLWNLAYDPIVVGLADACLARCPTYVDDLAGLSVGPVQTMRLSSSCSRLGTQQASAPTCTHAAVS